MSAEAESSQLVGLTDSTEPSLSFQEKDTEVATDPRPDMQYRQRRQEEVRRFFETLQKENAALADLDPADLLVSEQKRMEQIGSRVTDPKHSASLLISGTEHSTRFFHLAHMTEAQLITDVNAMRSTSPTYRRLIGSASRNSSTTRSAHGGGGLTSSSAEGFEDNIGQSAATPLSSAAPKRHVGSHAPEGFGAEEQAQLVNANGPAKHTYEPQQELQITPFSYHHYPLSVENQINFQKYVEFLAGPLPLKPPEVTQREAAARGDKRMKRYSGHVSDAIKPASDVLATFWEIFGVGADHRAEFTDKVVRRHSAKTFQLVAKEIRRYSSRSDAYGTIMRLIALRETLLTALIEGATNPLLVRDKRRAEGTQRKEQEAREMRRNEASMKHFGGVIEDEDTRTAGANRGKILERRAGLASRSGGEASRMGTARGRLRVGGIGGGESNSRPVTPVSSHSLSHGGSESRLRARFKRVDIIEKALQEMGGGDGGTLLQLQNGTANGTKDNPQKQGFGQLSTDRGEGGSTVARLEAFRQRVVDSGGGNALAAAATAGGTRRNASPSSKSSLNDSEGDANGAKLDRSGSSSLQTKDHKDKRDDASVGVEEGLGGPASVLGLNTLGGGVDKPLSYSTHENLLLESLILITHLRHVTVLIVDMVEHERKCCRELAESVAKKNASGSNTVETIGVSHGASPANTADSSNLPLGATKNDINKLIEEDLLVKISIAKRKAINKNVFEAHYRGLSRKDRMSASKGAESGGGASAAYNIDAGVEKFDKLLTKLHKEQALEEKAERMRKAQRGLDGGDTTADGFPAEKLSPTKDSPSVSQQRKRGTLAGQRSERPHQAGDIPLPLVWDGRNYLMKMQNDLAPLDGSGLAELLNQVANPLKFSRTAAADTTARNGSYGYKDIGKSSNADGASEGGDTSESAREACWSFRFANNPFVLPTRVLPNRTQPTAYSNQSPSNAIQAATAAVSIADKRSTMQESAMGLFRSRTATPQVNTIASPTLRRLSAAPPAGKESDFSANGTVANTSTLNTSSNRKTRGVSEPRGAITVNVLGLKRVPPELLRGVRGANQSAVAIKDREGRFGGSARSTASFSKSKSVDNGADSDGTSSSGSSSSASESSHTTEGLFCSHRKTSQRRRRGEEAPDLTSMNEADLKALGRDPVIATRAVESLVKKGAAGLLLPPLLRPQTAENDGARKDTALIESQLENFDRSHAVTCDILFQEDPELVLMERNQKHFREHIRAKSRLTAHRTRLIEEREKAKIGLCKEKLSRAAAAGTATGGASLPQHLLYTSSLSHTNGQHNASDTASPLSITDASSINTSTMVAPFVPDENDEPEEQIRKRNLYVGRQRRLLHEATTQIVKRVETSSRHVPFQKFFLTQILERDESAGQASTFGSVGGGLLLGGGGAGGAMRRLVGGTAGGGIGSVDAMKLRIGLDRSAANSRTPTMMRSEEDGNKSLGNAFGSKKMTISEMMQMREKELEEAAQREAIEAAEAKKLLRRREEQEQRRREFMQSSAFGIDGLVTMSGFPSSGGVVLDLSEIAKDDDGRMAGLLRDGGDKRTDEVVGSSVNTSVIAADVAVVGSSPTRYSILNVSSFTEGPPFLSETLSSSLTKAQDNTTRAILHNSSDAGGGENRSVAVVEDVSWHLSPSSDAAWPTTGSSGSRSVTYSAARGSGRSATSASGGSTGGATAVLSTPTRKGNFVPASHLQHYFDETVRPIADLTFHQALNEDGTHKNRYEYPISLYFTRDRPVWERTAILLARTLDVEFMRKVSDFSLARGGGGGGGMARAATGAGAGSDGGGRARVANAVSAAACTTISSAAAPAGKNNSAHLPATTTSVASLSRVAAAAVNTSKSVHPRQVAMNKSRYKFTIADDIKTSVASEGHRMFPPSLLNPKEDSVVDETFRCFTISWPVQQYSEAELLDRQRVIFAEVPIEANYKASAKAKFRRALYKIKMALSYFRQVRETKKGKRLHLAAVDFREWMVVAAPSFVKTVERDLVKWYEPLREKDAVEEF